MIRAILTSGSMRSLRHKPDRSCATKPGHTACHRHAEEVGLDQTRCPNLSDRAAILVTKPTTTIHASPGPTPSQRHDVEIAILANPDPADVAALPHLALIQSLWAGVERLVSELGPSAPRIVRMVDPEMARTMSEAVLAWTYSIQRDMPAYAH